MSGRGLASGNVTKIDLISIDSANKFYRETTGTLPPSDIGLGAFVERSPSLPQNIAKGYGNNAESVW